MEGTSDLGRAYADATVGVCVFIVLLQYSTLKLGWRSAGESRPYEVVHDGGYRMLLDQRIS
jgi:hypothetical protein